MVSAPSREWEPRTPGSALTGARSKVEGGGGQVGEWALAGSASALRSYPRGPCGGEFPFFPPPSSAE